MTPTVRSALGAAAMLATSISTVYPGARGLSAQNQPAIFTERTREAGLDFVHVNGMSGRHFILEVIGAGGALFDYDNDGDLDLYAVQGHSLAAGSPTGARGRPPTDGLFRNDLQVTRDGTRTLRFTDVTSPAMIGGTLYGMGVTAGDYNNDGWTDLYVTNWGSNQLLHNNGDGTFTDVTRSAEVDDPRWSTAAAFVDIDRDGWLDLFVTNYLDFTPENHVDCRTASGRLDYCSPARYPGVTDRLFRNLGNGRFEDVSAAMGIAGAPGKALGVVTFDADNDGWIDVYVANDGEPNFLWMNRAGRRLENVALLSGSGVNRSGRPEASMGVDAGDTDGDGHEDLFITHLTTEKNTLYVNRGVRAGHVLFEDRSFEAGLGTPSLPFTGFGTLWSDFDNDGWLDLPVVNGAVAIIERLVHAGDPFPLRQRRQLFRNTGRGTFSDSTGQAGPAFHVEEVGRGLAVGDLDNDGDHDLVIFNNNGPARLLINNVGQDSRWIGFRLVGRMPRRDMLGARVAVVLSDGRTLWRRARSDGGYLSAHDPRVLVGIGRSAVIKTIRVHWPDATQEEWDPLSLGRYHTLEMGAGRRR